MKKLLFAIILVATGTAMLLATDTDQAAEERLANLRGPQRWEYKTAATQILPMNEHRLNMEFGLEGWELVAMQAVGDGWVYVFKRKL